MALDSYANLKTEVAEWLNRQDLTDKIPTFIRLLEAQVDRTLRVNDMVTETSLGIATTGRLTLPTDCVGVQELYISSSTYPQALEVTSPSELRYIRSTEPTPTLPRVFCVTGTTCQVAPLPDTAYTAVLTYFAAIPKLSDTVTTSWLLDKHPDIYLYGTLLQAAPYLQNDERVELWSTALTTLLNDVQVQDERTRYGPAPLKARLRRPY